MKNKKSCPLAARIKKLMQADEDVGKIAQATPVMMARALELFLKRLCEKTIEVAQSRQAKTLSCSHLKHLVSTEATMDFLKDIVASAPDLAPEAEVKPVKRRRCETTSLSCRGTSQASQHSSIQTFSWFVSQAHAALLSPWLSSIEAASPHRHL
ncbi:histone-fold-containing protein [Haematococcus lacustris]